MIKKISKFIFIFSALTYQACNHAEEIVISNDSITPSFNCHLAKSAVEKAICDDKELATLDREVAALYKVEVDTNPSIKLQQRSWLKDRNTCEEKASIKQCLIDSYKNRKEVLSDESTRKNSINPTAASIQKLLLIENECSSHSNQYTYPFVDKIKLDNNQILLFVVCDEGAYQHSYMAFLLDELKGLENAKLLTWSIPQFDKKWSIIQSKKITGYVSFDKKKTELEITNRSNGVGTCGSITTFALSSIQYEKPIAFTEAIGEDDCFAGIYMNEWDKIEF